MTLRISKSSVTEIRHWPATTGDVALALGIPQSTVRYYELIGVVRPHQDSRRRRLYLEDDVARIVQYRADKKKK